MTTFNPYVITNVQDGFSVQSQGYWQGDLQDDPAVRFQLSAGVVASTQASPIWGGVAVTEYTAGSSSYDVVAGGAAPTIASATAVTGIAGFTVFNGSFSLPTTPQSPVPMANAGNSFNFIRLGTGARVVVACDSTILALVGSDNPQTIYWDVTNLRLTTTATSNIALKVTLLDVTSNGASVSYNSGTGFATWNTSSAVAVIII
jgi:hypothetical protein